MGTKKITQPVPKENPFTYALAEKVLARWSRERILIEEQDVGTLYARFRYDGSTCTDMGIPFSADFVVELGPASQPMIPSALTAPMICLPTNFIHARYHQMN